MAYVVFPTTGSAKAIYRVDTFMNKDYLDVKWKAESEWQRCDRSFIQCKLYQE